MYSLRENSHLYRSSDTFDASYWDMQISNIQRFTFNIKAFQQLCNFWVFGRLLCQAKCCNTSKLRNEVALRQPTILYEDDGAHLQKHESLLIAAVQPIKCCFI